MRARKTPNMDSFHAVVTYLDFLFKSGWLGHRLLVEFLFYTKRCWKTLWIHTSLSIWLACTPWKQVSNGPNCNFIISFLVLIIFVKIWLFWTVWLETIVQYKSNPPVAVLICTDCQQCKKKENDSWKWRHLKGIAFYFPIRPVQRR